MTIKKEYILDYKTEKDIEKAEKLQAKLYEKYNSVLICMCGIDKIKIMVKDKRQTK